jgi:hypothetical protein
MYNMLTTMQVETENEHPWFLTEASAVVREVRFLWSDPFDDPQRRFAGPDDEEEDDLDLSPLKKRRHRRRQSTCPDLPTPDSPPSAGTETPPNGCSLSE